MLYTKKRCALCGTDKTVTLKNPNGGKPFLAWCKIKRLGITVCKSCSTTLTNLLRGDNGFNRGKKLPPRTALHSLRQSLSHKDHKITTEHRLAISLALKGKPQSELHRRNKAIAQKGKHAYLKVRTKKWKNNVIGVPHTKEHNKKISESLALTNVLPEVRNKRSAALRRRYQNPEYLNRWSKKIVERQKQNPFGFTKGMKKPEVWTEKQRLWRLTAIYPQKDAKRTEVAFQNGLDGAGIEYDKHVPLLGQPDIRIKNTNILIFCDGDFFHANPLFYPDDFIIWKERYSKRMKRTVSAVTAKMIRDRDLLVTTTLQLMGYTILRFWEIDIVKNLSQCISRVKEQVDSFKNIYFIDKATT